MKYIVLALILASCGTNNYNSATKNGHHHGGHNGNNTRCIERLENEDYTAIPTNNATILEDGFAIVASEEGIPLFKVKQTWVVNEIDALTMNHPVNEVQFEILNLDDSTPATIEIHNFNLMMDMGSMAHSTNTCHATPWEIHHHEDMINIIKVNKINFVMGTRVENRWFFHNLKFIVDGIEGTIPRWNIPHKVL